MLSKLGKLGGLLGSRIDHPLGDSGEVRKVLAELPADNPVRALDEIDGWLDSLLAARDFPADRLFEVTRQLDEAAQVSLRRLARDYFQASRQSQAEEKRRWTVIHGVWQRLAACYEAVLAAVAGGGPAAERLRPSLPLLCGRFIAAVGGLNKWHCIHYEPLPSSLWGQLGLALRLAEAAGVADQPFALYPHQTALTSVSGEYLRVMVFQASAVDCLRPLEMELADRLIAHFVPGFGFGPERRPGSIYGVDVSAAQPPGRLTGKPGEAAVGMRYFQPGKAAAEVEALLRRLEAGDDVPTDLNLGGQYAGRVVLPALRHLAAYLAATPPKRRHDRHAVRHRMAVAGGRPQVFSLCSGQEGSVPTAAWGIENVSLGGFGAEVDGGLPDWLQVGALIALRPEGGDQWLLGVVRRLRRREGGGRVGVESLSRRVASVELRRRAGSPFGGEVSYPTLWIQDGNESAEMRFVLPPATFDLREGLEFDLDGRQVLLTPVARVEQGPDYEVARYRALIAE